MGQQSRPSPIFLSESKSELVNFWLRGLRRCLPLALADKKINEEVYTAPLLSWAIITLAMFLRRLSNLRVAREITYYASTVLIE